MEEFEGLELISKKEKDVIDNCDQIIIHCESYKKKVMDLRINLQNIRHAPEFRKQYYNALKLISNLNSHTCEFMLELELSNPLENEEDCEIIVVPCLPAIDGEAQNHQFEMLFLHGSSPWNFWLSHCEENITRRLKELLQNRASNVQELVETPICGDYVLYTQGVELHRALVQKTLPCERYIILDIDNGTTALIRLKRLFKMDEEISLIPYQAVNCSLMEDSEDSLLWNKEMEEIFASTLKRSKLTVEIIEENPGYPTFFYVKLKAKDIDDTELTVDVGNWITKHIIPGLKSGSSLSVSMLDAFFNDSSDESDNDSSDASSNDSSDSRYDSSDYDRDDSSDASNNESGDDSSQSGQNSPIIELPNDGKEEVDSSKESHILKSVTDQKISHKIVPVLTHPATVTNTQAINYGKDVAANMINVPTTSRTIVSNFNECPRRDYPVTSQTTSMVMVYPLWPTYQTAGSMMGYPIIPRHPNAGTLMGYPTMQAPPNVGSIGGYPINLGTSQTGLIQYHMEPRPRIAYTIRPPCPWSTNNYNTIVNQNYEMPNYELKTPTVLAHPDEELHAICSYVVSPNEFYVHLLNKNNIKIHFLEIELEQFYSECNSPNYQLRPGFKYCACKYIWDQNCLDAPLTTWFRAEVISMEGNEALVFLVDYGVKVWRNINELRVLDQRFCVYDKMAQRCHLLEVPMMENAIYSKDVSEFFKSLVVTKYGFQPLKINVFANVQTRVSSSLAVVVKLPERGVTINNEVIKFMKSKGANF